MNPELSKDLLIRWLNVAEIRDAFSAKTNPASDVLNKLRQELAELGDQLETNPIALAELLGNRLPERDAESKAGESFTAQQRAEVLKTCDEFRLNFLLLMMASQNLFHEQMQRSDLFKMLEGTQDFPCCPVVHGLGDIVYTIINGSCVMLMPDIRSSHQCELVLKELLTVFDLTKDRALWVIDFSGVKIFPLALMGTLIGYAKGSSARRIAVCWLKDGLLSDSFMGKVAKFFNCRKVGSHWFSW